MTTERIYAQVRNETGLTDVTVSIYNSAGTVVVSSATMTELGTTGIYYYDYTYTTTGKYLAVISSSVLSFQTTKDLELGITFSTHVPTTTITYADIKDDIGEAYNQIMGTTSTVLTRLIDRAENDIIDITGTTAGYSRPIRYLADSYAINHCLASLGPESDSETKLINMRSSFEGLCKTALRRLGKDYENIKAAWTQVNN